MATPGRYAKGDVKRTEILDNALAVFAREGYRSTSLRQVAAESRISLGGLMHYFDSKEHLLTEVLRHRDQAAAAVATPTSTGDITYLATVMSDNMAQPGLVELYLTLAAAATNPAHPAHEFFQQRFTRLAADVAAQITAGQAAGTIAPDVNPQTAARNIIAAADGIQMQWLLDRSIDMGAQVADAIARFVAPGAHSLARGDGSDA